MNPESSNPLAPRPDRRRLPSALDPDLIDRDPTAPASPVSGAQCSHRDRGWRGAAGASLHYYNEHDRKAASWLRELINQGQIPAGTVDERDIQQIQPHELTAYTQCHFFAGIGGWSEALRLAGWPESLPVWTGSCPCQPFSSAGRQAGQEDPRHLWPAFMRLIRQCRPERVFGEQVESAIGFGWLDGISADLETQGYAVGAAVLGAHSVGAPHKRQRLYWVAVSPSEQRIERSGEIGGHTQPTNPDAPISVATCRVADMQQPGLEGHTWNGHYRNEPGRYGTQSVGPATTNCGAWDSFDILPCRDGKARRVESGTFPLAYGVPGRVGLLRGYGNAIVPQVAAAFIEACEAILNQGSIS
jgi:DNA (cytosine-5)-methyltransferase 1